MPKGFYSQGTVILMSKSISVIKIKEILEKEFEIAKVNESEEQWEFGGPSVVIPYRPEVNGYVVYAVNSIRSSTLTST